MVCRQSLSRLPVAVISRHSERAAALPRRKKRSARRLNFVSAEIGSVMRGGWGERPPPAEVPSTLRLNAQRPPAPPRGLPPRLLGAGGGGARAARPTPP